MTTHVVHVAQPTTEGVARCVVDLVASQAAAGFRVTVVCPSDGSLAREAIAAGAEHVAWRAGRAPGLSVLREAVALWRILKAQQPDLVHVHSAKAGLVGRLALRGAVPTVFQPHAWSFLAVLGPVRSVAVLWERWAVRWTARIVCVSEAERLQAEAAGVNLSSKVRVVHNGVDAVHFAPRERTAARRRLGLPDVPLAVCVGRLSDQKGQDRLVRAWPTVRDQLPNAQLVLVGEGPARDQLMAAAAQGVLLVGNRCDPRDWYAAADVVVVPSRWEGMALVPLEAAASGRSVVITDVAGAREVVPPPAGEVVAAEDVEALTRAVLLRLRDPVGADKEGEYGRTFIAERFAAETSAAKMRHVYAELLSEGGDSWRNLTSRPQRRTSCP